MSPATHWFEPLRDWPRSTLALLEEHEAVVRIVVAHVRGSAPRDVGTSMLVSAHALVGTIGGGHLEHTAIECARRMLTDPDCAPIALDQYVLATQLAQCCGGVVEIWFEKFAAPDRPTLRSIERATFTGASSLETTFIRGVVERRIVPQRLRAGVIRENNDLRWQEPLLDARASVWLFGAGHVGQALARVLNELPVRSTWVDSREDLPPRMLANIELRHADDPVGLVAHIPAQSHIVVMTHSHALDYALCRALLRRGDFASLGLIGSMSKSARFRSRLARDGLSSEVIATLTCPIGLEGIRGKEPAVIAIAIAAQLLKRIEAGIGMQTTKSAVLASACEHADSQGRCIGCDSSRAAS